MSKYLVQFRLAALAAIMLLAATAANAAIVYQIAGSTTGTPNPAQDWSTPSTWNNNESAADTNPNAANNDYYSGRDENLNPLPALSIGLHLRAPNGGVFGGRTLHISNPVFLSVRPTVAGSTFTIADLYLTSGTISNHASGGTNGFFNGKITLGTADSNNQINSNGNRTLTFDSQISGTCRMLTLSMGSLTTDRITFNNTANNFTVTTLTQTGGIFEINGSGASGTIRNLRSAGVIRPKAELVMPLTDVTLTTTPAVLDLAFDVTVQGMKVTNGTAANQEIPIGVYTAATLATTYPGQFTSSGTLTVAGPPPNATKNWTSFE